jgi:hypothetical protein
VSDSDDNRIKTITKDEPPYHFLLEKYKGEWMWSWGGVDDDRLDDAFVEEFIALNGWLEQLSLSVASKDEPLLSVWWWPGRDYAHVYPSIDEQDKEDNFLEQIRKKYHLGIWSLYPR